MSTIKNTKKDDVMHKYGSKTNMVVKFGIVILSPAKLKSANTKPNINTNLNPTTKQSTCHM